MKYELNEKSYNASELQQIFNENKQSVSWKNYYNEPKTAEFVFLDQNKTVLVSDYPYGYKKANVKYSLLNNNYGGCLVFQSQNPKNDVWNKPKKSNYNPVSFMVINKDGHITTLSLDYNDGESKNEAFKVFVPYMTEKQKLAYAKIVGYTETMKHVEFKVTVRHFKHRETGEILSQVNMSDLNKVDECDENGVLVDTQKDQDEIKDNISKHIAYESAKTFVEIKNL